MVLVTIIMIATAWVVAQILKRVVMRIDVENEKRKQEYGREETDRKD